MSLVGTGQISLLTLLLGTSQTVSRDIMSLTQLVLMTLTHLLSSLNSAALQVPHQSFH
jgi:hypothetical protein